MKPHVLVTGGTGFLGSRVVAGLVERGHEAHVLARSGTDDRGLAGVKVRRHRGDLRDAESIASAVAAVKEASPVAPWVVHAGAVISYRSRDRELQREVNVEGTRRVVDACIRGGVERLLHVSSIVAVGYARGGVAMTEDQPFNGAELSCDYVDTKRAAEELALAAIADLHVSAVNPGAIFGGGPRPSNTQRTLELVRRGRIGPLPLVAPPGVLSVLSVTDAAEGCLLALERGASGRRYLLGESNWSHEAVLGRAADLFGKSPPVRVWGPIWRTVVAGARLFDRVAPSEFLTPQALRLGGVSFASDASRARSELGWRPRPFAEVLAELVATFREEVAGG